MLQIAEIQKAALTLFLIVPPGKVQHQILDPLDQGRRLGGLPGTGGIVHLQVFGEFLGGILHLAAHRFDPQGQRILPKAFRTAG